MQTNILEYLEATAPRLPDKIAYSDGTDDLTFSELSHYARALGSALAERGYYRRPIAVLMKKHPDGRPDFAAAGALVLQRLRSAPSF